MTAVIRARENTGGVQSCFYCLLPLEFTSRITHQLLSADLSLVTAQLSQAALFGGGGGVSTSAVASTALSLSCAVLGGFVGFVSFPFSPLDFRFTESRCGFGPFAL